MRKGVMLILMLMVCSVLAVPAFAQGGEAAAHSGTNWVAITSGFAMAFAVGLAALGQSKVAACGLRRLRAQSRSPSGDSAGPDSWPGLHRVAGAVYAGDHLCEGA